VTRLEGLPTAAPTEVQVVYSSHPSKNTLRRVSFSSAKKKKLVVNGIAPHDTAKFEALKRWCEVRPVSYFSQSHRIDMFTFFFLTELW
jgi:hypothetical protein